MSQMQMPTSLVWNNEQITKGVEEVVPGGAYIVHDFMQNYLQMDPNSVNPAHLVRNYTCFEDPWLSHVEVPAYDVGEIAGVMDRITGYSYLDGDMLYLRQIRPPKEWEPSCSIHACDAVTFCDAMKDKGYTINLTTIHIDDDFSKSAPYNKQQIIEIVSQGRTLAEVFTTSTPDMPVNKMRRDYISIEDGRHRWVHVPPPDNPTQHSIITAPGSVWRKF